MKHRLSNYTGNTPLIPIKIGKYTVWGKAEFMNPSGSVKDRMATFIINNAEKNGLLNPGDTMCEATSGNSGIAFAMLAAERGYKMVIVCYVNEWFNCNQFANPLNIKAHYQTTGPEFYNQYKEIKGEKFTSVPNTLYPVKTRFKTRHYRTFCWFNSY